MSIFGTIINKLFGKAKADAPADVSTSAAADASSPAAAPVAAPAVQATPPAVAPLSGVDVAVIMDRFVSESGQKLDWRVSIVDMMKALGMDSSLDHRKQLAAELGYTGDTNDSASMNIWLHKEVMKALAANGGTLPANLAG
ncbi:DUF3597 domain-containing protein [Dyella telluris]|uniref:DUF3597 domain-containing protein n=1 Tax=Dyella telluris TaxID=2763498 RepID=A0A7G8Q7W2_9GAMM|nr:DUF3597 domain-containing protein [Dyella telluris]QNK02870.1 DUF3597 domain-containing protein [Dyella telluris]